jgi:carboxymethylenebutenolidase
MLRAMSRHVLLAALIAACSSSKPATENAQSPGTTSPRPSDTGAVGEAEFKAMHAPPTTGPVQLSGKDIEVAGSKAYLSLPKGQGPFPAILVIHEWWGLNDNIKHWADRLASAGWAALAVDLYGGVVTATPDDAMKAMKAVDDAKAGQVITAGLDFLAKDPRVQAPTRAVIGWCFGGGWSLKTALAHPELAGAIIYYGQLETDPAKLKVIKGQLLGVFGTKDKGIPPAKVDEFEAALKQAGVKAEIRRYDADHAFANPSNPKYDEASSADAWSHVLAFLKALSSRPS